MKRTLCLAWLGLASGLLFGASQASAQREGPATRNGPATVKTRAQSQSVLLPQRASFIVTVETQAPTAAEASAQQANRVSALLDSLRRRQFSSDSAVVVSHVVTPVRGFVDMTLTNVAYKVKSSLRVPVARPHELGPAMSLTLKSGATGVSGARFESDSTEAAGRKAVREAVRLARANAAEAADAAGYRLGELVHLESGIHDLSAYRWSSGYFETSTYGNAEASLASPQSDIEVSASVEAEWRLLSR